MRRLGKYTGRIYTDDEIKEMQECGICIGDEESPSLSAKDRLDCLACHGCPESQKSSATNYFRD